MHIGLLQNNMDCEFSVNISRCSGHGNEVVGQIVSFTEMEVKVDIPSIELFYGRDVIVTLNDICDDCEERYYIPEMKTTG